MSEAPRRRSRLPGGLAEFRWTWPLVAWIRVCWWASQLLDGLVQAGLKRLVGTRYERTGGCIRSGSCCEVIAMEPPAFALRRPRLLAFLVRVGEVLYPFRYERVDRRRVRRSGDSITVRLRRDRLRGHTARIRLRVARVPSGVSVSIDGSKVRIRATSSARTGRQQVLITATDGEVTRTIKVPLRVGRG